MFDAGDLERAFRDANIFHLSICWDYGLKRWAVSMRTPDYWLQPYEMAMKKGKIQSVHDESLESALTRLLKMVPKKPSEAGGASTVVDDLDAMFE